MPTLAEGLGTLEEASIAIVTNRKRGSRAIVDALVTELSGRHRARTETWVKPSPYSPLSKRARAEVVSWADAVIATPGDCGHGSSVLRLASPNTLTWRSRGSGVSTNQRWPP